MAKASPAPTTNIGRRRASAKADAGPTYRARRDEIIAAAGTAFLARGFRATSFKDIADAIGMDRASLYYYFESKQDLFHTATATAVARNVDAAERVARSDAPPAEKIAEIVALLLESYTSTDYPYMFIFLQEDVNQITEHSDDQWAHEVNALTRRYERAVTDILQSGIDSGVFGSDAPPHVLTKAMIGMANWTHRWYRADGRLTAAEIAQTFAQTFLYGITAERSCKDAGHTDPEGEDHTMTEVMKGVRVLEVAEHTFVPAASALLSDWGADVIKIEPVERGDAMRGLASTGLAIVPNNIHVLMEHSNRGKRSLGLDLATPEGLDILYKLAATADIFLTNKLPRVREKLNIDVDDIRAHNPNIIYVRGTGQGDRGPDRDKGSYDNLAFWLRSGTALGVKRPDYDHVPGPPGPGFGDSIGAMTIAGGMMGALFHRERTGEATVVDVSLLGTGMWAQGQAIGLSVVLEQGWSMPGGGMLRNPLVKNYLTKDGRWLALNCLQGFAYWAPLSEAIGRPDLVTDPRFADHESLMENASVAAEILAEVFADATVDEWRTRLQDFVGQWTVVQDTLEAARDPQSVANGYLQPCVTAEGKEFELVAAPVQFDEQPAPAGRAPEFNEHGDAILDELGLDWDTVVDLKVRGVVA